MLAAVAIALFVAPAASASWGVSRVGAVQAVVKAVVKADVTIAAVADAATDAIAGRCR